jgi:hypothetical protein
MDFCIMKVVPLWQDSIANRKGAYVWMLLLAEC